MRSRRTIAVLGVVAAALASLAAPGVLFADEGTTIELEIQIAPSTLNLSYEGKCVTVHTNLTYTSELEDDFDWCLEGVAAYAVFPDDCGDLVAKFHVDEIAIAIEDDIGDVTGPTTVTMTLTGDEKEGDVAYEGSDEVRVIDVTAKKGS